MPKEFIDSPHAFLPEDKQNPHHIPAKGSLEEISENVDEILPDDVVHDDVIQEYYSPTTRIIFVLGKNNDIIILLFFIYLLPFLFNIKITVYSFNGC